MGEKGDKKMRIYKKKSAEKDPKECELSEFFYIVRTVYVPSVYIIHLLYITFTI